MNKLSEHLEAQPVRTQREWAEHFGISRPFLVDLLKGRRAPSLRLAEQIERATNGSVKVADWPNHAAVIQAASPTGDAA